jgi:NADH:ubiquinone reductase (non-electrogenic)
MIGLPSDSSEVKGEISSTTIHYDYLVHAVGAEVQDFGIKGVKQYACFMKELPDAERMQRQFMDCAYFYHQASYVKLRAILLGIETAAFPGQTDEEIERLLHIVVDELLGERRKDGG